MKVYLYPCVQAINLNIRRRCGQIEIVCHCSLLMLLSPAEQSIQLLIGAEQQLLLYLTINEKLGCCYLKTINLDLGKRCEFSVSSKETVIVCQCCILMNFAAPELSIQNNWGRATTFYILYHTSR